MLIDGIASLGCAEGLLEPAGARWGAALGAKGLDRWDLPVLTQPLRGFPPSLGPSQAGGGFLSSGGDADEWPRPKGSIW